MIVGKPMARAKLVRVLTILACGLFLVACRQGEEGSLSSYDGPVPSGGVERLGRGALDALAYSPDGSHLAAGGDAGLYYYTVDTLEEEWLLPSSSPVIALAFSPGGRLLAAALNDGTVALVDTANGELLKSLVSTSTEETTVQSLAWTLPPDDSGDQLLAAGYNDGHVLISRLSGGDDVQAPDNLEVEQYGLLPQQASGVTAMAFSPDNRYLATGNRTGVIDLWDAERSEWVGALQGHDVGFAVLSLVWSPDNRHVLSGGRDDKVIVWDALTFMPEVTLTKHQADTLGVGYALDGLTFASASVDGEVILWDGNQPEAWLSDEQKAGEISAIALAPDLSGYTAASGAGELAVWSLGETETRQSPLVRLTGHTMANSWVDGLAWSPDGNEIAAGLADQVIVWDVAENAPRLGLTGHASLVTAAAWSPNGDRLASGSRDGQVILWDTRSGEQLAALEGHSDAVADLAWSPDGKWLASAGSLDDRALVWDGQTGEIVRALPGTGDGLWSVAWSPDGQTLAAGTTRGEILFFDMGQSDATTPVKTLGRHLNWVAALAWSPDGRIIASAGADGRIVLTDVETGEGKTYAGHSGPVRDVAFSPDGARMASASRDKLVIVWDSTPEAATRPLATLSGHSAGLNEVAWSPDGQLLASGSDDGTVILWDVAPQEAGK